MSHFYGILRGRAKTEATRCGTKSGLTAIVGGWHVAVRVECRHNERTGKDEIVVQHMSGTLGHALKGRLVFKEQ